MDIKKTFSASDREKIVNSIIEAERNTSAEIRVHIDSKCSGSPLDEATKVFAKLNMHKTELRNGVLVYVAVNSRKCAIIGDVGINSKVNPEFWDECYAVMKSHFSLGDYAEGVAKAVFMSGKELKKHFTYSSDDINELPDEISFGK